jgi:hypothetical protein
MSKFKISVTTIFALFMSATLFIACNDETVEESKNTIDIEKILFEKYSLVKSKKLSVDLTNVKSINKLNTFDKVDEYTIENSVEKILIASDLSRPNSFIIVRGVFTKNVSKEYFQITKEMKINITLDTKGTGSLYVKNLTENEEFSLKLIEGLPDKLSEIQQRQENYIAAPSLCQREKGEKLSDCYKREVDEFCDGFIGCAALTQISVHILILALCSC